MRYFKESEFFDYEKMDKRFLSKLDLFRSFLGRAVNLTSSNDRRHNHVRLSYHYLGRAVDFFTNAKPFEVIGVAQANGLQGIGVYLKNGKISYYHVDDRDEPCFWVCDDMNKYFY